MQNSNGNPMTNSRVTHYSFGDYRGTPPSQTLTDRGFTGQKSNNQPVADLGLLYYNARYYIPSIGKFASADTIVPDPAGPHQFNRYAYTLNNPVKFVDPAGHISCTDSNLPGDDQQTCSSPVASIPIPPGFYLMPLPGTYSFSAYVFADENAFSGQEVSIPGINGQTAKWDFLFSSGGVVMQGTGMLSNGPFIHITNYDELKWADIQGRLLRLDPNMGWVVSETGEQSAIHHVWNWETATFETGPGREGLIPYYSVAAPDNFPLGSFIYVPELAPYVGHNGIFQVQDRGGLIQGHKFDLYVGVGFANSNSWLYSPPTNTARFNLTVYVLMPFSGTGGSCSPQCQ